jgi:hypothetical protein
VSSNPALGEVYAIQHYVIQFFTDLHSTALESSTLTITLPISLYIYINLKFKMRTLCSLQQNCSSSYMWGSALYFHVEHTCMIALFDWDGRFGPQIRFILFIEVYIPMSAVSGHVCFCFYDFLIEFWNCSDGAILFLFNFIIKYFYQIKVGLRNVKFWLVNRPFVLH